MRPKLLGYVGLIPAILRLMGRLGWALTGVRLAKRRALRAYEKTLRREGLPEPFISELVADYDLSLGKLLRGGLTRLQPAKGRSRQKASERRREPACPSSTSTEKTECRSRRSDQGPAGWVGKL